MIDDLVVENAKAVFLLESPRAEEINCGLPLLGASGVVFSQALLIDKDKPAGLQISKGGIPYTITNTLQDALQLSISLVDSNAAIKQHEYSKNSLSD